MAVVIVAPDARFSIRRVIAYGKRQFGLRVASKMGKRIKDVITLLMLNPRMGKIEPQLSGRIYEYRSFVIHEHFKLIYRLDEEKDVIYIVHFWDTRKEPKRLNDETKEK